MWHGFEGIGWGWWALGALHMVVFWALIIGGLVALARWASGRSEAGSRPLDILKSRYARGEITRTEFERMKRELGEP